VRRANYPSGGKIPGFRPGKAPYEVIRRYYSDEAIYEQAVDLLVDEVYPAMLKEAELNAARPARLKRSRQRASQAHLQSSVMPEVSLGDYQSVRLPYEFNAPGKEKLDQALEELQQMYGTTETVEREIQEGDYNPPGYEIREGGSDAYWLCDDGPQGGPRG